MARILVVDDVETERAAAVAALRGPGRQLVEAVNGLDGLKKALLYMPEVIVSDVVMPELTGYHLCRFLKLTGELPETKIFLLTGLKEPLDRFWGELCGADGFFVKGEGFADMVAGVGAVLTTGAASGVAADVPDTSEAAQEDVKAMVAAKWDDLLRETTLRARISELDGHAGSLPELLQRSLELLARIVRFDAAALAFELPDRLLVGQVGEWLDHRSSLLEEMGLAVEGDRPVELLPFAVAANTSPTGGAVRAWTRKLETAGETFATLGVFRFDRRGDFDPAQAALLDLFAREYSRLASIAWANERNRQMETRKSRLREVLVGAGVHDAKNVAMTLTGYVGLLRDDLEKVAQAETLRSYMEPLLRIGGELKQMLLGLMEQPGLERDEVPLAATTVGDLRTVVHDAVAPFEFQARKKGLELIVEQLPAVHADAALLRRVFQNLVANAIRFTTEGHVRIFGKVLDGSDGEPRMVQLGVEDTGKGVPPEVAPLLFTPELQLTRTLGSYDKGLGLYFCGLVVRAHRGTIRAEPGPDGRGSSFTFTLPADKESYERLRGVPPSAPTA
ncbi:MAG: hybrid sensor histidine kinase/response regulator [Candidatus Riflebacteria bacterium]|nr:hybrid sensor histidine kinase/response regulator [Candidatus Riflebacteria bacterium]